MENAKTIGQLFNAAPVSDNDFIPINQPNAINPITHQPGDTRKVTVKQITDYAATRVITGSIPSPYLIALNRQFLQIKEGTELKLTVNGLSRFYKANSDITLSISAILDTGIITNGKDYYLFLVPDNDTVKFTLSQNKIAPNGFTAGVVKLIGGFHTLCADAGSGMTYDEGGVTKNHPLNGYTAGDILPQSVWCLNHRPYSEPEGMFYVSSLDFWCDIYLQSGSGANTKSVYQGAITRNRQYVDFVEDLICVKKELLDDGEFAAAMMGSNEMSVVAGASQAGATTGGAGGRVDTNGRRMLSIYGAEEGCGSSWQFLRTTSAGGYEGSMVGQISPNDGVSPLTQGQFWSANARTVSDSQGNLILNPAPQSGGKGSFYYMCAALLAGGVWSAGAYCGSRARVASAARSRASSGCGGRGRSRALHG